MDQRDRLTLSHTLPFPRTHERVVVVIKLNFAGIVVIWTEFAGGLKEVAAGLRPPPPQHLTWKRKRKISCWRIVKHFTRFTLQSKSATLYQLITTFEF